MPTPPKPVLVLETEKRSHRTKKEKDQRKKGEAALLTGEPLRERAEVKANPAAHKEFIRLKRLLSKIGKAEDLYAGPVNRYCLLYAECREYVNRREEFAKGLQELRDAYHGGGELDPADYYRLVTEMQKNINTLDKLAADKRKMLLDIEKECVMTIAAALRAVPKKPPEEDTGDPMAELLGRRAR